MVTAPDAHLAQNPLSVTIVGIAMPSKSFASPSLMFTPALAVPEVVLAEVAAADTPSPAAMAMLSVASFAGKKPKVDALRVVMTVLVELVAVNSAALPSSEILLLAAPR